MSNFWGDDDNSDGDENKDKQQGSSNPFYMKSKYAYNESESSEEEKRIIKTPKEKLLDQIRSNYFKIKDFIESKNYISLGDAFDEVMKSSDKVKNLFTDKIPDMFLRLLFITDESINISKEERNKLTAKNNTAFNNLKKNFTKQAKQFEEELNTYKENLPTQEQIFKMEEESQKKEEANEGYSLNTTSSVDLNDNVDDPAIRRLKWVKKEKKVEEKTARPERPEGGHPGQPIPSKKKRKTSEDVVEQKKVITETEIEKELNEIADQRGYLGNKPDEKISRIEYLLTIAKNPELKIKLLNLYIHLCFDTSQGQFSALTSDMWDKTHESINQLLNLYEELSTTNEDSSEQVVKYILTFREEFPLSSKAV
jgi:translation initiation factor 3 subunit C